MIIIFKYLSILRQNKLNKFEKLYKYYFSFSNNFPLRKHWLKGKWAFWKEGERDALNCRKL